MVAYTTTYNLKKPTVADDEDVWGGYLNDSMDLIDNVLNGTTPVTGIDINSGTVDNVVVGATTAVAGTFTVLTANTSLGVTGNITVSGTVDGRDVAADGTKLDGVESGATADQTKADIDALGIAASTASTLATARNIALSGDVSGSASFNGSANISITATVADDSHNHVISNVDGLQTALDAKLASSSYTASDVLTKVKTVDGSGSGLDADTVDGVHESTFMRKSADSGLDMNNNNITDVEDIYLQDRIYHDGDTDTYIQFGTNQFNVYTGGSREITVDTTGVRLGDTGNGYFQPVSGSYGSIQIDGGQHGGWEGYSIGGRAVFMHNNSTVMGLYDDVNDHWALLHTFNGATELYYDGSSKLQTSSNGIEMSGRIDMNNNDIYGVDQLFHHGDTNTYMQFHAADQWRVVTGGSERLEVNNTRTHIDRLFVDAGVVEDYEGLSGTSPTCNVNNGGAFALTMTGNTTFTFTAPWDTGNSVGFVLELTGNGSTVTWPSSVDWAGGTAPDAPASGETDIYVFWTRDGGTTWYGVQSIDAAA